MTDVTANLLNLKFDELDLKIKNFARANNVPIILDEGLAFLENIIRIHKPNNILEIGTAIGYSAIRMHKVNGAAVTTIEKSLEMFNLAVENVKEAGLTSKITLINQDALEAFDLVKDQSFDLIFIDAAKAQYEKFFNLYTPLLSSCGVVVCDNMLFHGLVNDKAGYANLSRSVRGLVRKLNAFHESLLANASFDTTIFDIGDGLAVSVKRS